MDYTGSNGEFYATVTDPNGNRTVNVTDVLDHKVRVLQESKNPIRCTDTSIIAGNWCTTSMTYDAAGRLKTVTDAASPANMTTITYDSIGRRTHLTDPDMGSWDYDYDDNGNLTFQKDANGKVTNMFYDPLNRITRKDLFPTGQTAGPEDTTYSYDGDPP